MSAPSQPSPWAALDTDDGSLRSAVNELPRLGLNEVRTMFDANVVRAWPDGAGGVHVVVEEVRLGPAWTQETSWLGFTINYLYPDSDTYPHYVRPDLAHVDGNPLIAPFHVGQTFNNQPAVMVSRSSPNRVTGLHTAARKTLSVLSFIETQPANREQPT